METRKKIITIAKSCSTCLHSRFDRADRWLTKNKLLGICVEGIPSDSLPPKVKPPMNLKYSESPAEIRYSMAHAGETLGESIIEPPSLELFVQHAILSFRASTQFETNETESKWLAEKEMEITQAAINYYNAVVDNYEYWACSNASIIHYSHSCNLHQYRKTRITRSITTKEKIDKTLSRKEEIE